MKKILLIALLGSFKLSAQTQDIQLNLEVKDTIETVYNHRYTGKWINEGFNLRREVVKDSIGVDSVRVMRAFYWSSSKGYAKKNYIGYSEKKYLSKRKGNGYPLEN